MALKNFKDIINNKAYFVNSKDRAIFEEGDYASFFGFGESDTIEFIVYDANNNQLDQTGFGSVRYIPLTNQNIADYILLPDGTLFQALSFPKEYFVDVERLLREAGYDNGIFKTQITLINRRVGGPEKDNKLWISEISPSRTEVRLLPLKKPTNQNYDLEERFKIFTRDEEFRDDTLELVSSFLERINPLIIDTYLKTKYSDAWVSRMNDEYRLGDIDTFSSKIYNKFLQSAMYEFTNRHSDINSLLYGKPKAVKPALKLSKEEIKNKCASLLIAAIDFYLLKPDVKTKSEFEIATETSLDVTQDVLQTSKSDLKIETTIPVIKKAEFVKIEERDEALELKRQIKKELTIIEPDTYPDIKLPVDSGGVVFGGSGGSVRNVTSVNYLNPATGEMVSEQIIRENIK